MLYITYNEKRERGVGMTTLARIDNLVIRMNMGRREHNPPHIHAFRGNDEAAFLIEDGSMYHGHLTRKDIQTVKDYIEENRDSLITMWEEGRKCIT